MSACRPVCLSPGVAAIAGTSRGHPHLKKDRTNEVNCRVTSAARLTGFFVNKKNICCCFDPQYDWQYQHCQKELEQDHLIPINMWNWKLANFRLIPWPILFSLPLWNKLCLYFYHSSFVTINKWISERHPMPTPVFLAQSGHSRLQLNLFTGYTWDSPMLYHP